MHRRRPKPKSPTDLHGRAWRFALRRTGREFIDDQCTDLAAALTYYSVLALFPAALALFSLLGLVGQADDSVKTISEVIAPLVSPATLNDRIVPILNNLATSRGAGLTFVIGIAGALFSASGYVNAFSRAMNRIYEVEEGRPIYKLRPMMLLVTIIALVLAAVALVLLVVSGPLADSIGSAIGLGSVAVTIWSIAKWPALALVVGGVVALLYWATPNIQQPKFRWVSPGAALAIAVWVLASIGFAFYVANFSSYDATYGTVAGGVVALLWLWLTNLALLLGAELDAELERSRELQAGIPAEEGLQLPARDLSGVQKKRERVAEQLAEARALRVGLAPGPQVERPSTAEPAQPEDPMAPASPVDPRQPRAGAPSVVAAARASAKRRRPMVVVAALGFVAGTTLGWLTRKED